MATLAQLEKLETRCLVDSITLKEFLKRDETLGSVKLLKKRLEWVIIRLSTTYDLMKLARSKIFQIDEMGSEPEKIRYIYKKIRDEVPYSDIFVKREENKSMYNQIASFGFHSLNTEDFTKIIFYLKNRFENYLEAKIKVSKLVKEDDKDSEILLARAVQKDILYNGLLKKKIKKYFKLLRKKYENQGWQRKKRSTNNNKNKQTPEYKKVGQGILLG